MVSDSVKKGADRAPHRSLFKAMGYTDEEIARPLVAIVNAKNDIVPGHIHLDTIAQAVADGIRMAGGTPMMFPAIGICDGIAMGHAGMRYSLASRELIADSIESMVMAHGFDAVAFVPNCDKIVPGMLMAAGASTASLPYSSAEAHASGQGYRGQRCELNADIRSGRRIQRWEDTESDLDKLEDSVCPGCGSCAGMFTANSMNCLCEALGMALSGNGTIAAVHGARIRARETGRMQFDAAA